VSVRRLGHTELQELLGAYALDATEPDESAEVEAHLAVCPGCRAEVAEHREVAGALAFSGHEVPPGLWDRITTGMSEIPPPLHLERVRGGVAEPQPLVVDPFPFARPAGTAVSGVVAGGDQRRGDPSRPSPTGEGRAASPSTVGRRRRPDASRRLVLRPALAAAAAVALVFAGIAVARLSGSAPSGVPIAAIARNDTATMAQVDAALRAPGSRKVVLTSPRGSHRVRVDVVVEPNGTGYLYHSRLTPLPDDRTYQLWGVVGSERISYGLLGTAPGVEEFQAGSGLRALAITDEVASGVVVSTQPLTAIGAVQPPL